MPAVCLVIPCFNEAARLDGTAFLAHLALDPRISFCFVDDGSTDATGQVLASLAARHPDRVFALTLPRNAGKAEAVRHGMLHAVRHRAFTYVGYWDADLATPLSELAAMIDALDGAPACQIVLGSRWHRLGSRISRRAWRHILGRVFATIASLTLELPIYDSQCGAKLLRASAVEPLFEEPFLTRWMFDLELLARLRAHSLSATTDAALEVPLTCWQDVRGSRLSLLQMAATPIGFWRIRQRYRW